MMCRCTYVARFLGEAANLVSLFYRDRDTVVILNDVFALLFSNFLPLFGGFSRVEKDTCCRDYLYFEQCKMLQHHKEQSNYQ